MFLRKRTTLTLVVATRHRGALDALNAVTDLPVERREALTTAGLYHALKGAQLAIVDLEDVAESPDLSRERLGQVLGNLLAVTGAEFAAQPARYLDQARAASGLSGPCPRAAWRSPVYRAGWARARWRSHWSDISGTRRACPRP